MSYIPNIEILVPPLPRRRRSKKITTIVLHATAGGTALSSISHLRNVGNSYHYIIERDGKIYKCVPTDRDAFHSGVSDGPQGPDVNLYSIGISLANFQGFKGKMEGYTDAQIEAMDWLIEQLVNSIPTLKYITTHRIISPGRRADPKGLDLSAYAKKFPKLKPWRQKPAQSWTGPKYP